MENTLVTVYFYQVMVGRTGQLVYVHPIAQVSNELRY